jgi:hypothetical protein
LLIAKIGFIRTEYWTNNQKIANFSNLSQSSHFSQFYNYDEALRKVNQDVFNYAEDSIEKTDLERIFNTKLSFGSRDS